MKIHPYLAVANEFIRLIQRDSFVINYAALNRMVFCAHGVYLNSYGKALVAERFNAFENGPHCHEQLGKIRNHLDEEDRIKEFVIDARLNSENKVELFTPTMTQNEDAFIAINWTFAVFKIKPFFFNKMINGEGSAWHKAWEDRNGKNRPGTNLLDEEIRKSFSGVVDNWDCLISLDKIKLL